MAVKVEGYRAHWNFSAHSGVLEVKYESHPAWAVYPGLSAGDFAAMIAVLRQPGAVLEYPSPVLSSQGP